jgi:8-oxo-dGTP pyrophosphatase MutT (NUDIX family)
MSDEADPWTTRGEKTVYDNPWISVIERDVLTPAGRPSIYGIVRMKRRAVGVLPIEPNGDVHLVGQWRPPLDAYSWEMPEGGAEPGEPAEDCARRELEEEAGVKAGVLVPVLTMALSNSVTDEVAACFLAWDLSPGIHAPEDTEVFKHRRIHFLSALDEVFAAKITDSLTVATLLRAYHMAVTGALPAALTAAMLRRG